VCVCFLCSNKVRIEVTSLTCILELPGSTTGKPSSITYMYLLSPYVLQKLLVAQLVKKFPSFYETRRFITVFTRARHWSLY